MNLLVVALGLLALLVALGGCVTLTPEAEKIRVTRNPNAVRACESLGPLVSESAWGGVFGVHAGYENNLNTMLKETADKGGNVLLVLSERIGAYTASEGEAYRCEADQLPPLPPPRPQPMTQPREGYR